MEITEIRDDDDLIQYVKENVHQAYLADVFRDSHRRMRAALGEAKTEISITEGTVETTRHPDKATIHLRAIQVTLETEPDFNPGYTFIFGEPPLADKIIMISGRDPNEPFERSKPVQTQ